MAKKRSRRTAAPRPKGKPNQIVQDALAALQLANEDRAALEPRLPSGLLDGMSADLERLGEVVPGAQQKRAEKKAATAAQNETAKQVARLVSDLRTMLGVAKRRRSGTASGCRCGRRRCGRS